MTRKVSMRADQVVWEITAGEEELEGLLAYSERDYVSVRQNLLMEESDLLREE